VIHNDLATLKLLLLAFSIQDKMQFEKRPTALMYACQNGNVEIFNLLLDMQWIDVNATTFDGMTALSYAFTAKHPSMIIVEKLILHGAVADLGNQHLIEDEKNCWYFLCKNRFFSVLMLLWNKLMATSPSNFRPSSSLLQRLRDASWEYLTQYSWERNGMEYCQFLAMAFDLLMLNKYDGAPKVVTDEGRALVEIMKREKSRDSLFDNEQAIAYSVAIRQIAGDIELQSYEDSATSSPAKRFKSHDHRFKPMTITPSPIVIIKVYYQDFIVLEKCYFTGTNSMQVSQLG
jgi:hypothetical protein